MSWMEMPPERPDLSMTSSLNQVKVSGRSPSVTEHSIDTRWPRRRFSPTLNLLIVGGTWYFFKLESYYILRSLRSYVFLPITLRTPAWVATVPWRLAAEHAYSPASFLATLAMVRVPLWKTCWRRSRGSNLLSENTKIFFLSFGTLYLQ